MNYTEIIALSVLTENLPKAKLHKKILNKNFLLSRLITSLNLVKGYQTPN